SRRAATESVRGLRVPPSVVARRGGLLAAGGAQPGAVRRRQREALDAGEDHRRLRVLPSARPGLHARRHQALGRTYCRGHQGVRRHLRVFQARRGRQRRGVRQAADATSRYRRLVNAKAAKIAKSAKTKLVFTKKGFFAVFALFASFAPPAEAQNWDFDARTIAIGGVSGSATLASGMIERDATYQSIVLPFGLLQVLPDLGAFAPDSEHFDPVRAVEHAASPIHFIVDRDPAGHGRFASTIATARFYAGQPAASAPTRVDLGGVATSSWGGTIRLSGAQRRDVHGVYVGAGPYVTGRGAADINPQVIAGLDDDSRSIPSSPLTLMTTFSEEQVAIAVTGGYRGRYALPFRDDAAARDGIYVAVNYDYLI